MRLRLDMTLGELISKLTAPLDPHVTAGWVNIRKDGFPWRQMVADAECGAAEVSRVGRTLMAREAEIDRWLNTKGIRPRETAPSNPVPTHDPIAAMVRKAGFHAVDRTAEQMAADEEAYRRFEASPESQVKRAKDARTRQNHAARWERERVERTPRQQAALSYLNQHPGGLTTEEHCRQHALRHHMGYRDLNALVESGALKRIGAGRTARFYLVPALGER